MKLRTTRCPLWNRMHVSKDTKERGKSAEQCLFLKLIVWLSRAAHKGARLRWLFPPSSRFGRARKGGGDTLLVRKRETENWNPSNAGIKRKSEDGESRLTTPSCNDALWSTTCSGNKIRYIKNKGARRIQKTTKEGGKGRGAKGDGKMKSF